MPRFRHALLAAGLAAAGILSGFTAPATHAQSKQQKCQWALAQNAVVTSALNLVASASKASTHKYNIQAKNVLSQFKAIDKRYGTPGNEQRVLHELTAALDDGRAATKANRKNKAKSIKDGYNHIRAAVVDIQTLGC